jgi:ABC-type transporter Mla MlaB component
LAAPKELLPAFVHALHPTRDGHTILLLLGGRIERDDAVRLGDLVRDLLEGADARLAICDVGMVDLPEAAVVDLLCRIRLVTRRLGLDLEIRGASTDLRDLLFLTGLCDVVGIAPRSGLEVEG